MAIAKYFSKDLLAINQILKESNRELGSILLSVKVGVALDSNAVETSEGRRGIDLIVRLLSRLYPSLGIFDLSGNHAMEISDLQKLAQSINGAIEINTKIDDIDILVVAGKIKSLPKIKGTAIYFGSDNWLAKFSMSNSISFQNTENSIGCGVAACIAASNAFRLTFKEFIPDKKLDSSDVNFSILDLNSQSSLNPKLKKIKFTDVVLVGAGAIGNGFVWALSSLGNLEGRLDIVDHEELALSNLQRYIMTTEDDMGKGKVGILKDTFPQTSKLQVVSHQMTWEGYLNERGNWNIETVAAAIDNKKDRIKIQTALPKKIFNSYTETNLIGVARHTDFINSACMACGYIPSQRERNYTEEVAENCNIPSLSNLVKDYINLNLGVEQVLFPQNTSSLLDVISTANGIPRDQLIQFHGKKVNQFYSEFVCGGISLSMSISDKRASNIDAPLAFQSAMAGILLAGELILDVSNLRKSKVAQQSHFYPLNEIGEYNPFNHNLEKDKSGRCICSDQDFKERYRDKWKLAETNEA
jgi:hypothetical protein